MPQIMVTSSTLRSRREELQRLNNSVKKELADMEATVRTLDASWTGEAHDAFHQSFNAGKARISNFMNAITEFCVTLDQIISIYEQAEAKNRAVAIR